MMFQMCCRIRTYDSSLYVVLGTETDGPGAFAALCYPEKCKGSGKKVLGSTRH